MSGTFDPGPGWRASTAGEAKPYGSLRYSDDTPEHEPQWWVREAPVLPLPTAPHTVIRVTWKGSTGKYGDVMLLDQNGFWRYLSGDRVHDLDLSEAISGFEVLSEPRGVTAAEIMEDFETHHWDTSAATVNAIFRNYGVKS